MSVHHRRIKLVEFALGATQFECQVKSWKVVNNTEDGERFFAQCPDGEFREEADDDYALELVFFSDWRSDGISDYLTENDKLDVTFTVNHHPDIAAEHVQWTGTVRIKAPTVGDEARAQEMTEVTLPIKGKPVYTRVGA